MSQHANSWGWGSEGIDDDDPDRDRKMHDRITGRELGLRSMNGPHGFAQWDRAPEWWRKKQIRAARAIATKQGPPEVSLHPHVWHHLNNRTASQRKDRK